MTPQQIAFVHHVRYQDAMLRAWMRRTKSERSYRPEDVPAHIDVPTNSQRSHAECLEFIYDPPKPGESYAAYLHCDRPADSTGWRPAGDYRITTFTGDTLAIVTDIVIRRDRTSWVTDARGSFWARGIDGRIYHGRHNGVGMWCRMRLAKKQPKEKQP